MRTFDDMLSKQLKDDEFRKEYEAIQPEMDVITDEDENSTYGVEQLGLLWSGCYRRYRTTER